MTQVGSLIGCICGTAVGDALGLPYEGLSQAKISQITSQVSKYRLIFGKGMVSDDTEHICMVAQSLIVSAGDEKLFLRALTWRFKWWLIGLPAGIGYATLRAIVKLWLGFSPRHSGVFSAGNGAAMRSAILGVCYGNNPQKLGSLVKVCTRITHTDPKAEYGAVAVAIAAYLASTQSHITPQAYYQTLQTQLRQEAEEFLQLIEQACQSADQGENSADFAASLGLNRGISGYVYHTVPLVIQVWLKYQQNYATAIAEIIQLGGDTDTTAAILGGIIGARVGKDGIPRLWLDNLWEYPRTVAWMEKLGVRLAHVISEGKPQTALALPIAPLWLRNLIFLTIIILHGLHRLYPF